MKKVLLATTALALSAGVAYAEVSISGNARMGLQYTGGVAGKAAKDGTAYTGAQVTAMSAGVVKSTLTTAQSAGGYGALTAAQKADAEIAALRSAAVSAGNARATAVANLAAAKGTGSTLAQLKVLQDIIDGIDADLKALAAAEAAIGAADEVAAVDAKTTFEKRMTVTMSGSVETTSGLTFGATMNLRANEGAAAVTTGARVHMATNGLEVGMGNIWGAIESMPGVYSPSAGLTGLGWGGLVTNTVAKGFWGWDAYSSSGNGAEGIEVMYTAGAFTGHLSYSDTDRGSAANRTAAYGAYTMGDWTVAVGYQDSSVNTEDKTVVTVGGKVGDFGVGIGYADNDGEAKIALNGSATMGAVTVSAYVANEESATDNPMGLGVAYDLGGAKVVGGVAKTATGQTRADMGVSFSF